MNTPLPILAVQEVDTKQEDCPGWESPEDSNRRIELRPGRRPPQQQAGGFGEQRPRAGGMPWT